MPDLEMFHATSRSLSRKTAIQAHLGEHYTAWDRVFPPFPECRSRRRSMGWEWKRGRRDAYLRSLIVAWLPGTHPDRRLVVNPATVFGRHARAVAAKLPAYHVIGADIDHRGNRLYRIISPLFYRGLSNYEFVREDIYEPDLSRRPAAVIFFGACGSVTDGSMDYALATKAPFLICRSCCHDNIGGNTVVEKRPGGVNRFFRFKNYGFARGKAKRLWPYYKYFSDRYQIEAYPRSKIAQEIMDSETALALARNSADSDVCRSLIDLDRCQFLDENGYDVMYRDELFFAHRRDGG